MEPRIWLHLSRGYLLFKRGCFGGAYKDALTAHKAMLMWLASLKLDSVTFGTMWTFELRLKIRAAYRLGLYQTCREEEARYVHGAKKAPGQKIGDSTITPMAHYEPRIAQHLREQRGEVDWETIPRDMNGKRLHTADYYGPVEIRTTKGAQRGVVATTDIKAGTVLIKESPFFTWRTEPSDWNVIQPATEGNRLEIGNPIRVVGAALGNAANDPSMASTLRALHPIDLTDITDLCLTEEARVKAFAKGDFHSVNPATLHLKLRLNCFGSTEGGSLFRYISMLNHACAANTVKVAYGDVSSYLIPLSNQTNFQTRTISEFRVADPIPGRHGQSLAQYCQGRGNHHQLRRELSPLFEQDRKSQDELGYRTMLLCSLPSRPRRQLYRAR